MIKTDLCSRKLLAKMEPCNFIKNDLSIFNKIRNWAKEKGIYAKCNPTAQTLKFMEEVGELSKAVLNKDQPEIIDAIGDCVVVLTNLAYLCGLSIEECIDSAYDVIEKRTGKMKNGTFVKDK